MSTQSNSPINTHNAHSRHAPAPAPAPAPALLPPKSPSTMWYISAVAFTYASLIFLLSDSFWSFYFAGDVWLGMDEATDLLSTALAMFLGAYGALTLATHSVERVRNVHFGIWVCFLLFSFAYGGSVSGSMCVANVCCCAVVLCLLLRQ